VVSKGLLALGGAFIGAEALGVTNFSGDGGISPQALQQIAQGQGGGTTQIIPTGGGGTAELVGQIGELTAQVQNTREGLRGVQNTVETFDRVRQAAPDFDPTPGPNVGTGGDPNGGERTGPSPTQSPGGSSTPTTSGNTRGAGGTPGYGNDLQDFANPKQGTQAGDVLAGTGEAGKAGSSFVNDVVEGSGDVLGDPGKALQGEDPGGVLGFSYRSGQATGQALDELNPF